MKLKQQQIIKQFQSTIVHDVKYRNRWVVDEEIASTIKDERGL